MWNTNGSKIIIKNGKSRMTGSVKYMWAED